MPLLLQICIVGRKNEAPFIALVYPDKEMLKTWVQKNKDATAREQVSIVVFSMRTDRCTDCADEVMQLNYAQMVDTCEKTSFVLFSGGKGATTTKRWQPGDLSKEA